MFVKNLGPKRQNSESKLLLDKAHGEAIACIMDRTIECSDDFADICSKEITNWNRSRVCEMPVGKSASHDNPVGKNCGPPLASSPNGISKQKVIIIRLKRLHRKMHKAFAQRNRFTRRRFNFNQKTFYTQNLFTLRHVCSNYMRKFSYTRVLPHRNLTRGSFFRREVCTQRNFDTQKF